VNAYLRTTVLWPRFVLAVPVLLGLLLVPVQCSKVPLIHSILVPPAAAMNSTAVSPLDPHRSTHRSHHDAARTSSGEHHGRNPPTTSPRDHRSGSAETRQGIPTPAKSLVVEHTPSVLAAGAAPPLLSSTVRLLQAAAEPRLAGVLIGPDPPPPRPFASTKSQAS
jgi:hypothetical protein